MVSPISGFGSPAQIPGGGKAGKGAKAGAKGGAAAQAANAQVASAATPATNGSSLAQLFGQPQQAAAPTLGLNLMA